MRVFGQPPPNLGWLPGGNFTDNRLDLGADLRGRHLHHGLQLGTALSMGSFKNGRFLAEWLAEVWFVSYSSFSVDSC